MPGCCRSALSTSMVPAAAQREWASGFGRETSEAPPSASLTSMALCGPRWLSIPPRSEAASPEAVAPAASSEAAVLVETPEAPGSPTHGAGSQAAVLADTPEAPGPAGSQAAVLVETPESPSHPADSQSSAQPRARARRNLVAILRRHELLLKAMSIRHNHVQNEVHIRLLVSRALSEGNSVTMWDTFGNRFCFTPGSCLS